VLGSLADAVEHLEREAVVRDLQVVGEPGCVRDQRVVVSGDGDESGAAKCGL
jgi:hypothetical protein